MAYDHGPYPPAPSPMSLADEMPLLDLEELSPLPPARTHHDHQRSSHPSSAPVTQTAANGSTQIDCHPTVPAARYVTVSALLSRSGAVHPLRKSSYDAIADQNNGVFASLASDRHDQRDRLPNGTAFSSASADRTNIARSRIRPSRSRTRADNGNALETLGTLLLHRDHAGRASAMSFQRYGDDSKQERKASANLASAYKAFFEGIKQVSATTLGIHLPATTEIDGTVEGSGTTIAQRRARMRAKAKEIQGEDGSLFLRVKAGRNKPTFDVLSHPVSPSATQKLHRNTPGRDPLADPRSAFKRAHSAAAAASSSTTASASASSSSIYGFGSSFGIVDPPAAPPSPLGMPGVWPGGRGWSPATRSHEDDDDLPLLLPPPLLDDHGSDPRSFEGLLGIRRRREQEEARKRLETLAARNRPAHKVGMLTALGNFVKAAHAADMASRKRMVAQSKTSGGLQSARPGTGLLRRHTDYSSEVRRAKDLSLARREEERREVDDLTAAEGLRLPPTTSHESRRASVLLQPSCLETVYERGSPIGQGDEVHPPLHGCLFPSQGRKLQSPIIASCSPLPSPPRQLPVHPSAPPSPLIRRDGCATDDGVPHSVSTAPPPPRLGPTILSLPPSPWTPHFRWGGGGGGGEEEESLQPFSFTLMATSLSHPSPGTPRLTPTHLSIMPSPLTAGSLTLEKTCNGFWSPQIRPSSSHMDNDASVCLKASPVSLQPIEEDTEQNTRASTRVRSRKGSLNNRRTPATILAEPMPQCGGQTPSPTATPYPQALSISIDWVNLHTYVLWSLVALAVDFVVFCLTHLIDLSYEVASNTAMAYWFVKWLVLNLTGRTVLSRCLYEAFCLIQDEWSLVAQEDHEENKCTKAETSFPSAQSGNKEEPTLIAPGLSRWETCKGILELIALQTVTKERWLREGSGLVPLQGWEKRHFDRRAATGSFEEGQESSCDSEDEEEEDLIVTRRDADVLEFTRTPRIKPRGSSNPRTASVSSSDAVGSDGYFAQPRRSASLHQKHTPRSLVKTLKWASRLAVGAYGLHVHIVDLPPTFTPSGNRFTRQTFAHLSRLSNADDVLHADIQQMSAVSEAEEGVEGEELYQPTFYVARDHVRKRIVVAIRGTQSFSDIIADLDMKTAQMPLKHGSKEDRGEYAQDDFSCHAGVLRAAQGLLRKESTLFQALESALGEHQDFGLTFVGHSLGAAIGSAVVMLLAEYNPTPAEDQDGSFNQGAIGSPPNGGIYPWTISSASGLPAGRPIQAIAFAPPATFSFALSARAARGGSQPLVYSVVLGSDFIPRAGHGQARELRRVLGALSRVRKSQHGSIGKSGGDARTHVLSSWWEWRKLAKREAGDGLSTDEAQQKREIEEKLWRLRNDVEADLYSAIKRRALQEEQEEAGKVEKTRHESQTSNVCSCATSAGAPLPPTPWVGPHSAQPLHRLTQRRQTLLDRATLKSEAVLGGIMLPAGRALYLEAGEGEHEYSKGGGSATANCMEKDNGSGRKPLPPRLFAVESPLSFFALPEFATTMFASHLPSSYEAVIEEL